MQLRKKESQDEQAHNYTTDDIKKAGEIKGNAVQQFFHN
ncbi:hypothetical protein FLA_2094 [Filimonas lacunae]|nr:hypothetical protein FLA_2094 [Filimonas lacunae]